MKYWFIIHSLPAYFAHSDFIGKEKNVQKKLKELKKEIKSYIMPLEILL